MSCKSAWWEVAPLLSAVSLFLQHLIKQHSNKLRYTTCVDYQFAIYRPQERTGHVQIQSTTYIMRRSANRQIKFPT